MDEFPVFKHKLPIPEPFCAYLHVVDTIDPDSLVKNSKFQEELTILSAEIAGKDEAGRLLLVCSRSAAKAFSQVIGVPLLPQLDQVFSQMAYLRDTEFERGAPLTRLPRDLKTGRSFYRCQVSQGAN